MAQTKPFPRNNKRIDFGSSVLPADYPDFLDIQLKSFEEFFQIETLPEKMTVSIGNLSGRKCVLKKCTVKIKPTANSASSE